MIKKAKKGKYLILKVIAVLVIQVLLLTQAEFALAVLSNDVQAYEEASLKFQRMTDRRTSLISGISGTCNININIAIINSGFAEKTLGKIRVFSRMFLNVFIMPDVKFTIGFSFDRELGRAGEIVRIAVRGRAKESRAPPIINGNIEEELTNRTV
ncbi:MAG: hypothetical protein HY810_09930 [Candidatus Omnitrophica bacterium]|nr:hypothetical protein [Candidatus Omnitrophota bacterium]